MCHGPLQVTTSMSSNFEPLWQLFTGECGLKVTSMPEVFMEPTASQRCLP